MNRHKLKRRPIIEVSTPCTSDPSSMAVAGTIRYDDKLRQYMFSVDEDQRLDANDCQTIAHELRRLNRVRKKRGKTA